MFEHKSYQAHNIALQLLKYMLEIWETKLKKENKKGLPMIIPLVVYHGKESWSIKDTLGEMIIGYKELPKRIQRFIPDYEYVLYDLSRYTDEEIKGEARTRIIMTVFRDIIKKDAKGIIETIITAVEYLRELEDKETGIEYFEILIRYIFNAVQNIDKNDVDKIIKKIETNYSEGSEMVMTIAEILREEGMTEGIILGEKIGGKKATKEQLVETVSIQLKKKLKLHILPFEIEDKIQQASITQLKEIRDNIFEIESLEDAIKYLS